MSTVPNQQIQQPLSNENIDKIVESSPLAQCIEPAVTEIATVMQSVYDSQELLAKQLDTIEASMFISIGFPHIILLHFCSPFNLT